MARVFILLVGSALLLMSGCDRCCKEHREFDTYQVIPDSIRAMVPYQDGEMVHFKSAAGSLPAYEVERTLEEYVELGDQHCDTEYLHYEEETTRLMPADSGMEIRFEISSWWDYYGDFNLWISRNLFHIDTKTIIYIYSQVYDSLVIDNTVYHDVFHETPYTSDTTRPDYMAIDSIHYNYAYGILAIYFPDGNHVFREE